MEWILINKKQPPETEPVLFCTPELDQWSVSGGEAHSAITMWTTGVGLWKNGAMHSMETHERLTVNQWSCWMPLPQPPAVEMK